MRLADVDFMRLGLPVDMPRKQAKSPRLLPWKGKAHRLHSLHIRAANTNVQSALVTVVSVTIWHSSSERESVKKLAAPQALLISAREAFGHRLSRSYRLHVDIFRFFSLRNILSIPLKWWVNFLKSWTLTGYFPNSTGSSATMPTAGSAGHSSS